MNFLTVVNDDITKNVEIKRVFKRK